MRDKIVVVGTIVLGAIGIAYSLNFSPNIQLKQTVPASSLYTKPIPSFTATYKSVEEQPYKPVTKCVDRNPNHTEQCIAWRLHKEFWK